MTDAERRLALRQLRFPRDLEREYQAAYYARTLLPLRFGFGVITLLMVVLVVKNLFIKPLAGPLAVLLGIPLAILALTFLPAFRHFWKPFLAITATAGGLYMVRFNITNPDFMRFFPDEVTQMLRIEHSLILFMTVIMLLIRLPFVWTAVCVATFEVVGYVWAVKLFDPQASLISGFVFDTMLVSLALMLAALSLERYHRSDFISNRLLEEERGKSERLLLNVLPASIAERLKTQPEALADSFAEVTVLFADIVDFTPLASRMGPLELVGLLNTIFSRFDELTERHGLERIKTIGDAYMVAGGLPEPKQDHASAVATLALEMMEVIREFPSIRLRIGIHTGAVVAGVIGTKRFLYDLWGDTVNVASRMESHGAPGMIMVTEDCKVKLEGFHFGEAIVLQVKGKGEMVAYPLFGRRDV